MYQLFTFFETIYIFTLIVDGLENLKSSDLINLEKELQEKRLRRRININNIKHLQMQMNKILKDQLKCL